MSKKIIISLVIILTTMLSFLQYTAYAKYIMNGAINMNVYIDKTAPVITIKSNHNNGSYEKTNLKDIIKNNCAITVDTTDNIKIKENKYIYNPNSNDFNNIPAINFETGTKLSEDGYYKIIAIDTSGNKTEIIVLIDKTAPEVKVQYFKKGEENKKIGNAKVMQVAGVKKNLASEEIIETDEEKVVEQMEQNVISTFQTRAAGSIDVYNENDLRNAINNGFSNIRTCGSINLSSPLYINRSVYIYPIADDNALRYSGTGAFITVQNGGTLTLDSIVLDTRGFGGSNVIDVNVLAGGKVILKSNSILDAGLNNIGMVVNSGATAEIKSCHVAYCNRGIIVKGNGNLVFSTDGSRSSEFWNNSTAISFEDFTGTTNFNQSNIKIRNNTNGIVIGNSTGTINLSSYNIYDNETGIDFGAGNLNITGGKIYNNATGIYLNPNYQGRMSITNVHIYDNTKYAINHSKNGDDSCNIFGGTISGKVYLGQRDNYINTNDKYPVFEVTPSQYFFKRKLIRTSSNACANTEVSKITLTPKDSWYKYVDNEYIVLWNGGNVIVRYKDYYGNILKQELKNGTIGTNYSITPPVITGYDLIYTPPNSNGTYTQNDIIVDFKYDLVNVAKVNFEDLLSGVVSAKYWYSASSNQFTGNGTDFSSGTVFEKYGNYKVVVVNNVGLEKELIFTLNEDSLRR